MFFNPKHEYGIHYSVRRKFLVSAGKNSLEPPLDFKTKKQAIQTPAMKAWSKMTSTTTTGSSSSHIDNTRNSSDKTHADKVNKIINKNNSINDNDNNNNNGTSSSTGLSNFSAMILNSRKSLMQVAAIKKPKKNPPMIIEHFSSNRRQDWTEADEAGCHLYINKNTGEVSPTCPYEQRHITSISSPMTSSSSSSSISLSSYDHEHYNHHVENSRIQTPTSLKQFNNVQHNINGSTSISGNTNNKQQQQQQNYHQHHQQQQRMTMRTLNNANTNYNKQNNHNNNNNISTPIVQLKKYSIKKHSSSPPRHLNKINIDDDDGGGEEEDDDDNDSLGTGSLVYDSKELDDLFDVLDHYK